ncbi:MAG: hypothetical protein JWO79_172 [Actinomycetia bacterium]|nr:hypothetical protein [Actinomycetes bacterium]MDQ1652988.1 hypothetical protein [Cryptosporangiaceae bacterium]
MENLPPSGGIVEGVLADGTTCALFVRGADDGALTVMRPANDLTARRGQSAPAPDLEDLASVAWPLGGHWYVAPVGAVRVSAGSDPRWHLVLAADPVVVNRRRFVRGGGGETVELAGLAGHRGVVAGTALNISENAVRCQVPQFPGGLADVVRIRLQLGERVLDVPATVGSVHHAWPGPDVEVLLHFDRLSDAEEQGVRQYLFQRELAARQAARGR